MTAWQVVFMLLSFAALIALLLPPKTHSFTKDILKERRESITSRRLNPLEKLTVRVRSAVKNAGLTMRTYIIITVAAFFAGIGVGTAMFGGGQLGMATGIAFLPLPYIYMILRGQTAVRKETESLENAMSVITNAYMGCNDIVESFYGYVREKNRNRDPSQTDVTPFDEFVTEVTLINPDVERGLYILEAKIRNYHFSEWVKMLQMCNRNHDLKFALPPIVKAMGDAKAMQIESDTQMGQVWRDYIMTVVLMFGIIPILRIANADWFTILTTTTVGKLLIGVMLVMALVSAFIVTRITKPISTHLGRPGKT